MRRGLIVVRHAAPAVVPGVDPAEWPLSDAGVAAARRLGEEAVVWGLRAVYTSPERKARETATALAGALAVQVLDGLAELQIDGWHEADAFRATVCRILEHPTEAVDGAERAADAAARFAAALDRAGEGPLPAAVVSHGRVITAWMAAEPGIVDPYGFWRALPMPAVVRPGREP